jgi:hypothetical protein
MYGWFDKMKFASRVVRTVLKLTQQCLILQYLAACFDLESHRQAKMLQSTKRMTVLLFKDLSFLQKLVTIIKIPKF